MINIKETESQKVYVTSDTHFSHNKTFLYGSRGFSSIKEHDDAVIDSINKYVFSDSYLFHLGDFCLNTTLSQFEELLSRINCQNIYMLTGNHANPHYKEIYKPMVQKILGESYTDDSEVYPLRYKNIVYLGNYAEVIINGQFIVLSHFPIYIWNHMSGGSWHLTGHSHYGCTLSQENNTHGKILDVGVDGHKNSPWSFDEIKTVMNKKQFIAVDQHHV